MTINYLLWEHIARTNVRSPTNFFVKNRAACDSMFGFGGNVTLVSYVLQTKQKKNVVLFRSMHHDDKTDPESSDMKKPFITIHRCIHTVLNERNKRMLRL